MKKVKEKKIKKPKKPKKIINSTLYTIIFLIFLLIIGAGALYGLYYLLTFLKTYGEVHNSADKMNIVSICATMIGFVLTYVIALFIMNRLFRADGNQRFGVQNKLIIFDVIITGIVFGLVYLYFAQFKIIATSLFTIRYFPNSYMYIVIPLVLVPNLFMVFYVDRFIHFGTKEEDIKNSTPNMNSTLIDEPVKKDDESQEVWEEQKPVESKIEGVAEVLAEEEAKKPKEEVSHIAIKTKEELAKEAEENKLKQSKEEMDKAIAEANAKTVTGAQAFNGFEKPSATALQEATKVPETTNPFNVFGTSPVAQSATPVTPEPKENPVAQMFNQNTTQEPVQPESTTSSNGPLQFSGFNDSPKPTNSMFASSVAPTTVSNSNDTYVPPEGTNPHQFDAVKTNLYPEKNPMPGNEGYQTNNYNNRLDSSVKTTVSKFFTMGDNQESNSQNPVAQMFNQASVETAPTQPEVPSNPTTQTFIQPSNAPAPVQPEPTVNPVAQMFNQASNQTAPSTPIEQAETPVVGPIPTPSQVSGEKTCPICGVHLDAKAQTCFMCGHHF